ncbi:MAG: type II secretion system protein GspG [Halioglobus sp.]
MCGEYDADLFRGSSSEDYFRFLTVGQTRYVRPNTQQWDIFCSNTPAEALLEQACIVLFDAGNTELAKITLGLSSLSLALERYYKAHFVYPTSEQGLEALVSPPANPAAAGAYPQGGYFKAIPLDPWGRPYVYEEEQWGGTEGRFTISTTGADGVVGGGGKSADVSTAVLPYLRQIANVIELQ